MYKRTILLSKDVLGKFYLPIYGNRYWKTPNIDELAAKGTIFQRHYTAAPSSSMSYYSMFTGQYPYESKIKSYRVLSQEERFTGETFFDKARKRGYECHVVWEEAWMNDCKRFSECYGEQTVFHPLRGIKQKVGVHAVNLENIEPDPQKAEETLKIIEECIAQICKAEHDVFVWMHLPHVWNGCTGYGADIDWFDRCVGMLRKYFPDNELFITADHGNMNGAHGKLGYAFDVYEEASSIPLITPRIQGQAIVDYPTVNIDLFPLIFDRKIIRREYVYSDSAYFAQSHRKLAIIHGRYKYIFSANKKKEELYDVEYDPHEWLNLMQDKLYDVDRGLTAKIREMYFYPYWDIVFEERERMRKQLQKIWRTPHGRDYARGVYEKWGKTIKRRYIVYRNRLMKRISSLKRSKD